MKKFVFAAAVLGVFTLASCKKDYTCKCSYTFGGQTTSQTVTVHGTKSDAETACNNAGSAYSSYGTVSCSLQ